MYEHSWKCVWIFHGSVFSKLFLPLMLTVAVEILAAFCIPYLFVAAFLFTCSLNSSFKITRLKTFFLSPTLFQCTNHVPVSFLARIFAPGKEESSLESAIRGRRELTISGFASQRLGKRWKVIGHRNALKNFFETWKKTFNIWIIRIGFQVLLLTVNLGVWKKLIWQKVTFRNQFRRMKAYRKSFSGMTYV